MEPAVSPSRPTLTALCLVLLSLMWSCTESRSRSTRTSVMDYLYPADGDAPQPDAAGARLQLPLRIGIAFVPPASRKNREWGSELGGLEQDRLLGVVEHAFAGREWVERIDVIPTLYLSPGGGFDELEQIGRLYDIDVIALVSVDQIQHDEPSFASVLYLTVVGSFVIPAQHVGTATLIDAAVFDVRTRRFLLRAPGRDLAARRATQIGADRAQRLAGEQSLTAAMADLTTNLQPAIDGLAEKVRSGARDDVDIVARDGRSFRAGGALGLGEAGAFALIALGLAWWRRA